MARLHLVLDKSLSEKGRKKRKRKKEDENEGGKKEG